MLKSSMIALGLALGGVVPLDGEGEFCVGPAPAGTPKTEVIYQASGSTEIEICVTNDGPATMTVRTKCADTQSDLVIEVDEDETKCQCCKITETSVTIPSGSGKTCGSYTTGSCTAPPE